MPSKTEQENMCPKALSVRKASETFGSVGNDHMKQILKEQREVC